MCSYQQERWAGDNAISALDAMLLQLAADNVLNDVDEISVGPYFGSGWSATAQTLATCTAIRVSIADSQLTWGPYTNQHATSRCPVQAPAHTKHLPRHNLGCSWSCLLPMAARRYKSMATCLQTPSLHPQDKAFQAPTHSRISSVTRTQRANMMCPGRLAQLAKKWERMSVLGIKRLTL
jgi:hypothetical protein